jgi:hypothetical protein
MSALSNARLFFGGIIKRKCLTVRLSKDIKVHKYATHGRVAPPHEGLQVNIGKAVRVSIIGALRVV